MFLQHKYSSHFWIADFSFALAMIVIYIICTNGVARADTINLAFNGNIKVAGCTVSSSTSVTVSMGDWYATDFTGMGSTTSKQPIPIVLNCAAKAKIIATIQADSSDAQNGEINVTSSGGGTAATGIGVQLVDAANNPLLLNSSFIITNSAPGGSYSFDWYARYIQTSTPISAGPANAVAVLTLSYQ